MSTTALEDDLRELFALQAEALPVGAPPELDVGRRRSLAARPVSIAAAAVLIVGALGTGWLVSNRDTGSSAPAPDAALDDSDLASGPPPVEMTASGWNVERFEQTRPGDDDPLHNQNTFLDPALGFSGPRLTVIVAATLGRPPDGFTASRVAIGTADGELWVDGSETMARWFDSSERAVRAYGYGLSPDELIAAASAITVDAGGTPVATAALPRGLQQLTGEAAAVARQRVYYVWRDGENHWLDLEVHPGGSLRFASEAWECCDARPTAIEVDGEPAVFGETGFGMIVSMRRGPWIWTFSDIGQTSPGGAAFVDPEQFLDAVSRVRVTDIESWQASQAQVQTREAEIERITAALRSIPMPAGQPEPGFDDDSYDGRTPINVADSIAGQMRCAWWWELRRAYDEADPSSAATAVRSIVDLATLDVLAGFSDIEPETGHDLYAFDELRAGAALLTPFATDGAITAASLPSFPIDEIGDAVSCYD